VKQICGLCDNPVEQGSRHKLTSAEAKKDRGNCPYCKESNVPMCRLAVGTSTFECGRCRAKWTTRPD
jgi:hypothetical protein